MMIKLMRYINKWRKEISPLHREHAWKTVPAPTKEIPRSAIFVITYILAIMEEKHGLSYEINREANVLPGVLGRICSRPCEDQCRHGWPGNGEPVSICHLKRSAADLKDRGHRLNGVAYHDADPDTGADRGQTVSHEGQGALEGFRSFQCHVRFPPLFQCSGWTDVCT